MSRSSGERLGHVADLLCAPTTTAPIETGRSAEHTLHALACDALQPPMSGLNLEAPEAIQRSRLLLRCTVAGASRRAFKTLISPQSTPQIRGWLPPSVAQLGSLPQAAP